MIWNKHMLRYLQNNLSQKYIAHLCVNTIIFVVIAILLPIRFETNDDTVMLLISSGAYSGVPDAHLVFINYIYGFLLSSLYTIYSGIEWYTILFAVIHIISLSILSWRIFKSDLDKIYKILLLILFYSLEVYCVSALQFTTTAAICALSGLILFVSVSKPYQFILSIFLFFIAALIRFEAAFLVLLIFIPVLVYRGIIYSDGIKKYLILFMLLIILPILGKQIDIFIYNQDPKWKEYKEYNLIRGKINDNLNVIKVDDLPNGIIESDYWLLLNFFQDTKVLNLEKIQNIQSKMAGVSFEDKFYSVVFNLWQYKYYVLAICIICFFLFFELRRKEKYILIISLSLLLFSFVYASIGGTLKGRVFISSLFAFIGVLTFVLENISREKQKKKNVKLLFISLLSILTLLFAYDAKIWYGRALSRHKSLYSQQENLSEYINNSQLGYLVPYKGSIKMELYSPFQITNSFTKYNCKFLGWLSKIPFNEGILESYEDLINKNEIVVDKGYDPDLFFKNIKESILYHYNRDVQIDILYENDRYFLIKLIDK